MFVFYLILNQMYACKVICGVYVIMNGVYLVTFPLAPWRTRALNMLFLHWNCLCLLISLRFFLYSANFLHTFIPISVSTDTSQGDHCNLPLWLHMRLKNNWFILFWQDYPEQFTTRPIRTRNPFSYATSKVSSQLMRMTSIYTDLSMVRVMTNRISLGVGPLQMVTSMQYPSPF